MYDLEEQEKIDALKAWWKQYGKAVIAGVVIAIAVLSGIKGWTYYQATQAEAASIIYESLQDAAQAGDVKRIRGVAGQLMEKYSGTAYAPRAALIAANANYQNGDAKSAKAQLQWAINHAGEVELQDAVRLRLAGLLLDERDYNEAQKLLDMTHVPAFDGLYADLKGDLLLAQGKREEAKAAYRLSMSKLDQKGEYRHVVQIKLDALGGEK